MIKKLASWLAYEILPPYLYNNFDDLQIGDVILVAGRSRLSGIINFFTGSKWTHLAIYMGDGKVMEAFIHTGVILSDIETFRNQEIMVLRHKEIYHKVCGEWKQQAIKDLCMSWLGKPYDGWHLFHLAWYCMIRKWLPRLKKWAKRQVKCQRDRIICSRLITYAYFKVALPVKQEYQVTLLPHEFVGHPDFKLIYSSKT